MSRPELGDAALYGLVGDVVRSIDPYTEADPVAVAASFLATYGNYVGVNPHINAGGRQGARLNVLLIGRSAKARKGTSWYEVANLFTRVDSEWVKSRCAGGLASGEAVISSVAGERADPRLLIVESEFARILSVSARQGSILSMLVRQAWDSGKLENRTKHDSQVVTGAHISMVAHITVDELRSKMAEVDVANGFANRFLYFGVGRSKLLPTGAQVPESVLADLASRIRTSVDAARQVGGEMRRTPAADRLWDEMYRVVARDEPPGDLGEVLARAEPQLARLSVIYAATDGTARIDVPHLEAAFEVWRYSRETAARLFHSRALDTNAVKLLNALRDAGDAGLSGTQIRDLFQRHLTADQAERIRADLQGLGLASEDRIETGGRPRLLLRVTRKGMDGEGGELDPLPSLAEMRLQALPGLESA